MILRTVALWVALATVLPAWKADRVEVSGTATDAWIIPCKDGTRFGGKYGDNGPTFEQGSAVCAHHQGLIQSSISDAITRFQVVTTSPGNLTINLGDLVSTGAIDPHTAGRLANSPDPAVWARIDVGLDVLTTLPPTGAITLITRTTYLPGPVTKRRLHLDVTLTLVLLAWIGVSRWLYRRAGIRDWIWLHRS